MKTQTQNNAELIRLCEMIKNMPVAMLTTVDASGALVGRPMSPLEMDGHGALWFFTDLRSEKIEQLRTVNLSFADSSAATYVSVSGHGELHSDRARIEQLWTPFARPWFPEGADSFNLGLLKIVPNTAEYWDTPHSKMVRMFAMAASIVSGKPIAMGENETLTHLSAAPQAPVSG